MNTESVLLDILALLAAAVIAIPLFHRLGLGAVLGYLAAGAVLGPWGMGVIVKVTEISHFAEFGVVFLLFLIGIEMKPARLWVMRHWVFGLGMAQLLITGFILSGLAMLLHLPLKSAIIAGFGLALSSTAFGLQILSEKAELASITGRISFSILLLQDLAVVPLLTLVSMLATGLTLETSLGSSIFKAVLAIASVVLCGRYLLNPVLDRIAASKNNEVFIAAAVLLVLGVAHLMSLVGLSMELGAFMAGLMLAESNYRHQIEADIQPFRGILLGLFFMTVGMSFDFGLLMRQFWLLNTLCLALIGIKALIIALLCRVSGINAQNSLRISMLLAQGGEFGFVLFGFAMISGVMDKELFQLLTLMIAMSMGATPFLVKFSDWYVLRFHPDNNIDAMLMQDFPDNLRDHVIIAGFGRVGQRVAAVLDVAHIPYIALEYNQQQVMQAKNKAFSVYFGDARRHRVLLAAGANRASMLLVCLDNAEHAEHLVHVVRQHFPHLVIHARAQDRAHCGVLLGKGADKVVSETLEASLRLAGLVLSGRGLRKRYSNRILEDYRRSYIAEIKAQIKKQN